MRQNQNEQYNEERYISHSTYSPVLMNLHRICISTIFVSTLLNDIWNYSHSSGWNSSDCLNIMESRVHVKAKKYTIDIVSYNQKTSIWTHTVFLDEVVEVDPFPVVLSAVSWIVVSGEMSFPVSTRVVLHTLAFRICVETVLLIISDCRKTDNLVCKLGYHRARIVKKWWSGIFTWLMV